MKPWAASGHWCSWRVSASYIEHFIHSRVMRALENWVHISTLPRFSVLTWGKLHHLLEPQFFHLKKGNDSTNLIRTNDKKLCRSSLFYAYCVSHILQGFGGAAQSGWSWFLPLWRFQSSCGSELGRQMWRLLLVSTAASHKCIMKHTNRLNLPDTANEKKNNEKNVLELGCWRDRFWTLRLELS